MSENKTGFDKYLLERMKDPKFAEGYNYALKYIYHIGTDCPYCETTKAFYDHTVYQRNEAWAECERLKKNIEKDE